MAIHAQDNTVTAGTVPAGLRVLVVEDSGLIAAKVAQALDRGGCTVVGPVASLPAALDLVMRKDGGSALDAALLDIDLRGEPAFPLAEALQARGVPFLFLTGYGQAAIPEAWRWMPRVEKPFEVATLLDTLGRLVADGPVRAGGAQPDPAAEPLTDLDHRAFAAMRANRELAMERLLLKEEGEAARKR